MKVLRWRVYACTNTAAGKTKREIAEHFSLKDEYVVKQLLSRENRKERRIKDGFSPRHRSKPWKKRSEAVLVCLHIGNQLLRDFLQLTGRK